MFGVCLFWFSLVVWLTVFISFDLFSVILGLLVCIDFCGLFTCVVLVDLRFWWFC